LFKEKFLLHFGSSIDSKINDTVGVTVLVVIPGDELDELVIEGNSSSGIKDGRVLVSNEVARNNFVFGVGHDALELSVGSVLDGLLDLVVGGRLLQAAGEIHNRDVRVGDTEGHTGQLAVELRNDLANSLGSSGGGGDDVLASSTSGSPVLSGGSVDSLLGGSDSMDGGHESLHNAEFVVDDLGEGSKAVGGARGVGDDSVAGIELGVVDAHDEHRGILGRSGDDHQLGSSAKVSRGSLLGGEDSGGLDHNGGS